MEKLLVMHAATAIAREVVGQEEKEQEGGAYIGTTIFSLFMYYYVVVS